ncbi:hypothetical protein [Variovorax paradoxus]|uniref:hypothetical protein n=1 Tax=Variovorax paradoxus TaxID=34073 RepID=UPI0029C6084A|nr:hypothetical protein [Variovorax paradoxus]WPH22332.1 hypothetical protein RZE78_09245 [Variovorax paradoxus]
MHLTILGVNHSHQMVGHPDGNSAALRSYLMREFQRGEYDAIAEEFSEEAIALWGCSESTAKTVGNELGVPHHYCDPTSAEREALGVPTTAELKKRLGIGVAMNHEASARLSAEENRYWPLREAVWLTRLRKLRASRILFILGADHVLSFSALLTVQAVRFNCLNPNWEP